MDYQDWFKEKLKTYKNDPEFILDGILLNINEMICGILERRGMTRREFAKKLNVSPAYITKLLRGDPNLTLKSLVKISRALGMSLDVRLKESEMVKKIDRDFEKSDFETIPFEVSGGSINDETKFIVKAA